MAIFFIINLSSFSTSYNFRVVCLYYTIMIPSWKIQIVRKIILLRTVCIFGQFCKLELVGAQPLHLADARPFYRLKAPLGLSFLHFVSQTRTCRGAAPPSCYRKTVLSLESPTGVFIASLRFANANLPKEVWLHEKNKHHYKHLYCSFYWCIYWTRGLYCLGLQNSSRIIRCAISTVVYKHLDIWCIDHYFVTDLHCDKSDHQS